MMKIKDLKHKPQELPCCNDCIHKGKGVKYCVQVEKCFDIMIHNFDDLTKANKMRIDDEC